MAARDTETIREAIVEALRTVYDPEIPVSLYELGLIYEINVDPAGQVEIVMTLTAPGCPVADILPREVEQRVLAAFAKRPLFRKTSCGVAFAHGIADYNGHYCIREICDICPAAQLAVCAAAHRQPDLDRVRELVRLAKLDPETISIDDRRVEVAAHDAAALVGP